MESPLKIGQLNCRKAGPMQNSTFGPGPTLILIIRPLIEIATLLFSRDGEHYRAYN